MEKISYRSQCGFLLTGIAEVMANAGVIPEGSDPKNKQLSTPRKTGVKQGLFIFLVAILLMPILVIFAKEMEIRPAMFILGSIILLTAGVPRMIYAKLFESNEAIGDPTEQTIFQTVGNFPLNKNNRRALRPAQTDSVSSFIFSGEGALLDTNHRVMASVAEKTTGLLPKAE